MNRPELRFQMGKETVFGTPVTATAKLMGVVSGGTVTPEPELLIPDIDRYGPPPTSYLRKLGVSAKFSMYGTFEDMILILRSAFGDTTKTGAGDPYTWPWTAAYDTAPTLVPVTIEYGVPGASNGWKLTSALLNKLSIKASAAGEWMMDTEWIAAKVEEMTLTSLSDRTYEIIMGYKTGFAVDASGGTMGATSVGDLLRDFDLSIDFKRQMHYYLNPSVGNSRWPSKYSQGKPEVSLKTTVDFDSTSKAYITGLLSGPVEKQITISANSGSGTHTVALQMPATLTNSVTLYDGDDLLTVALEWAPLYHSSFGAWFKASVLNALSAMP